MGKTGYDFCINLELDFGGRSGAGMSYTLHQISEALEGQPLDVRTIDTVGREIQEAFDTYPDDGSYVFYLPGGISRLVIDWNGGTLTVYLTEHSSDLAKSRFRELFGSESVQVQWPPERLERPPWWKFW